METPRTRLLIPGLRPFYDWAEPLSWAFFRATAGLMIVPHGWPKLVAGISATAASALAKRGIQPAELLAVLLIETARMYTGPTRPSILRSGTA